MVHDSVREELQTKIGTGPVRRREKKQIQAPAPQIEVPAPVEKAAAKPVPATPNPRPVRTTTTELNRQKTSKTLVEFQTKNPTIPDWRLQIQNAVRSRKSGTPAETGYQTQLVTSGANALKAEYVERSESTSESKHEDQRIANALKRIADSRKTYLPETVEDSFGTQKPATPRNYPFNVVSSRTTQAPVSQPEAKPSVNVPPKPRLVSTVTLKKTDYYTNKLPPLPEEGPISSFDIPVAFILDEPAQPARTVVEIPIETDFEPVKVVPAKVQFPVEAYSELPLTVDETIEFGGVEADEIEDLAPFASRFNAGLFDLIIGSFTSLILLSPIAFAGGDWYSPSGLLALAGTCSIVMFLYLTSSLALFGRTAGMKLFSLELIDADLNEYPSFHQAAVSSAVYLLTLPLGGLGFLTIFFNDEKRAAHDIVSGTIIVNEF